MFLLDYSDSETLILEINDESENPNIFVGMTCDLGLYVGDIKTHDTNYTVTFVTDPEVTDIKPLETVTRWL